ncbi:MAG: hypothetical protein CBC78_004160 [Candidatus Pelagibacter sp. TMED118]|nr:MAG: hypothetical protein CBC78_004160 [Candidatus Pelagibacter sp. TMED118]
MIKLVLLILILFLNNCSMDSKSGMWSEVKEKKNIKSQEKILFEKRKTLNKEFNPNVKIALKNNYDLSSFNNNLTNNNQILNYDGVLDQISKYKFSKIARFNLINSQITITENDELIFFDGKGNIFKLNKNLRLIWKKNLYTKKEKKLNPILNISYSKGKIIVTDNLSNYFLVDGNSGEILWKKKNSSLFNSQIKIVNNYFFSIDFDNIFRCYSIENGKEVWKYESQSSFIKSKRALSIVSDGEKIFFINSIGEITALSLNNGNLLWQTPTQSSSIIEDSFTVVFSDLVLNDKKIYLSNNKNELIQVDANNGIIMWTQNISSTVRPAIIEKLIFTISMNGYLVIMDKNTGNILRSTLITKNLKKYQKKKFEPSGFVIAKNNLYLTLSDGNLLKIKVINGKVENLIKVDNNYISRPVILKKQMYIVSDNVIKKFN